MHPLPVSFALLTYTGYWRPVHWPSNSWKYRIYNAFTVVMIIQLYWFTFCGIVDAVYCINLIDFIEKFTVVLSVLGVCLKLINIVFFRSKIIGLSNMLLEEQCLPQDEQEKTIQTNFDHTARVITIYFEIINEASVFFASVGQYRNFKEAHALVFNWVPYDISSTAAYWATLIQQTVSLMVTANASVAHETLIAGLLIQICAQLDILSYRVKVLTTLSDFSKKDKMCKDDFKQREKSIISDLIKHHLHIYKFAQRMNDLFMSVIFIQFSISSAVLSSSVYRMSAMQLISVDFLWGCFYLTCMLLQLFLYCWFGNEVMIKSTEICNAVYEMDWIALPVNVMQDLLIIMTRCSKPIKIISGYTFTLSIESFTSILKISYSAYNFLQNSK